MRRTGTHLKSDEFPSESASLYDMIGHLVFFSDLNVIFLLPQWHPLLAATESTSKPPITSFVCTVQYLYLNPYNSLYQLWEKINSILIQLCLGKEPKIDI